ncbi:hypothetical protein KEM48_012383 [Puccinia striiformis f. sp. tritici PST-130]|nr:hypothetical protein KEM48_012383 [Puccinia striiformis f. sp. tritici PST-130]
MAWMSSKAIGKPSRRLEDAPEPSQRPGNAPEPSRRPGAHPEPSRRPGAHPGHRNRIPMALELIQAIGIASQRPGSKYSIWFEYSNQKTAAAFFESNRIEFEYSNRFDLKCYALRVAGSGKERLAMAKRGWRWRRDDANVDI